jgi:metal-responsive CopG/Arc/MetJ family transcriptional regulator
MTKRKRVRVTMRFPDGVVEAADKLAEIEGVTRNDIFVRALEKGLKEYKARIDAIAKELNITTEMAVQVNHLKILAERAGYTLEYILGKINDQLEAKAAEKGGT